MMFNSDDTICAIATAQGGAIGIIRVSGTDSIKATAKIFSPANKNRKLEECKPYNVIFGNIIDDAGNYIDEVLISIFRAPHSYTGEDSTEIACHGSQYILSTVLKMLLENGCRIAEPGEYTKRAFLNGKMDLSQAEAVADLIASSSASAHRIAMNQMRGGFSNELKSLRDQLLKFVSLIELELDFSDHEDLEFADRDELKGLAVHIESVIKKLASSYNVGNAIKNGIPTAIIGETNAGKSTLLNTLLNEEKAIVSDLNGTTRDAIEDTLDINGILFRFIDTAGIRETKDSIEALGIERTFQKIEQAQIIIWVIDSTNYDSQIDGLSEKLYPLIQDKQLIITFNKSDIAKIDYESVRCECFNNAHIVNISAKKKSNIDELKDILVQLSDIESISQNETIITNARHYEALSKALESMHNVQQGLENNISGDFLSQDIRDCISYLNEIVGEISSESVLENIFKNFCVGK